MEIMLKISGTVNVDCGKGIVRVIELDKIHPTYVESLFTKTLLKDRIQDTHANVTLDSCEGDKARQRKESEALVDKYIEALYTGTARMRGNARVVSGDPMMKYRIAAFKFLFEAKFGKKELAALNKRDDASAVILAGIGKNAEKVEAIALEYKAEADKKAAREAELAGELDLSSIEF